jgi:hypothetical protein
VLRRLGVVVMVVLVAALSGCSDDASSDSPDSAPTGSGPSGSASSPPSDTPTAQPSAEPSAEPSVEPSVEPATGTLMELEHSSVRVPASFEVLPYDDTNLRTAGDRRSAATIALNDVPAINPDLSLSELARINIGSGVFDRKPKIVEPVTISGVRMYHATGPVSELEHFDEFGAMMGDAEVWITFTLPRDFPAAKRQRLVDSVLATLVLG